MDEVSNPEDMRERADWMAPADDRILELLRSEGNLTPDAINQFGGPSPEYSGTRCKKLAKYGLVEQIARGLYRITDDGRAYLNEDLNAGELEPVDC